MAKFTPPSLQESVTRTSIRVPREMLLQLENALQRSSFNRKQRSLWIESITIQFLQRSDAANLIAEEFIVPGSTVSIPITIGKEFDGYINRAIESVLAEEGIRKDRSSVIRTAVTQLLLANAGMQLSPEETRNKKIAALGGLNETAAR